MEITIDCDVGLALIRLAKRFGPIRLSLRDGVAAPLIF